MNYQEFKDNIAMQIKDYLPQQYQDATVEIQTTIKNNNRKLDGLLIRLPEENLSPTIYLNDLYEDYEDGRTMEDILDQIAEIREMKEMDANMPIKNFLDFEEIKGDIIFQVIGAEENQDRLSNMPHRKENDIALVYRIMVEDTQDTIGTIQITTNMMKNMGVDENTLYQAALENTQREFPATFRSMDDVMTEMIKSDFMGININELSEDDILNGFMGDMLSGGKEEQQKKAQTPLYVLSNSRGMNGAAALFYPDMKEQIAEQLGGNYFVLPSSIHEVLIGPVDAVNLSYEELKDMVNEINETQVAPEEVLTGAVYHYDRETKMLTIADEKDKKVHDMEKPKEKASIRDTLKEKAAKVEKGSVGKSRTEDMEL